MAQFKRGGGGVTIFLHLNHLLLAVLTIVGLHFAAGQLYDWELSGEGNYYSKIYWTGAVWAGVVGLMGISSLCIMAASMFRNLPNKVMKWYYLTGALLILLVASLGLGINEGVTYYNECLGDDYAGKPKYCAEYYGYTIFRFCIYMISYSHAMLFGVSYLISSGARWPGLD